VAGNHTKGYFDGFRGVAVLLVWLSHSSGRDQAISGWLSFHGLGHIGVMLFFVLSGFLLSLSIAGKKEFYFTDYLIRRFLRIAPLYYLVVSIVYAQQLYSNSIDERYLHITDGFLGYLKHLVFYKGDGVFWTIPTEFVFYLVLPFIALYLMKGGYRYFVVLFVAFFYGVYHILIYAQFSDHLSLKIVDINQHSQYLDVLKFDVVIFNVFCLFLFFTIILVSKKLFIFEQPFYHIRYLSTLYAAVFGLALFSAYMGNELLQKFMSFKPFIFCGVVGYSWYLLHMPILELTNMLEFPSPVKFILSTFFTAALSYISYRIIEKPFVRLGERLSRKN
jgi:peptidoglycan/LPS O-acetylase OafA/YrhL